jgi:CBS domain-containing protein
VYDYVPSKVDWLAHNLPVEGERATPPTAGRLIRDDVVRCRSEDRVAEVLARIEDSPYDFALVTSENEVVVGRLRAGAATGDGGRVGEAATDDGSRPVGEVMELDPSTVRPHRAADRLAETLAKKDQRWAIVTTPEGRLLGVSWREDLERAATEQP